MIKKLRFLFVLGLCLVSLSMAHPVLAQSPTIVVEEVNLQAFPEITATISVFNTGRAPLRDLPLDGFEVLEDGRPLDKPVVTSEINPERPIAISLVLDLSGSAPLEEVQQAANQFLDSLGPNDRVALIGFNTPPDPNPNTFDPFKEAGFNSNIETTRDIINDFSTTGKSAVYEAILKGVNVTANEPTERKAVLVMSDGEDRDSRSEIATAKTPEERAIASRIPIFTVGISSAEFESNLPYLTSLANNTGGRYQAADDLASMGLLFQNVGEQLRHEYRLTFRTDRPADGENHTLTFRTNTPEGQAKVDHIVTYPTPPEIPQIVQLERQVNTRLEPLQPEAEVRGTVLLVPQISAQNAIFRAEYRVNGDLVESINTQTVDSPRYQPWEWAWNTRDYPEGAHQVTVIVQDEQSNVSQPFEITLQVSRLEGEATPTPIPPPTEPPAIAEADPEGSSAGAEPAAPEQTDSLPMMMIGLIAGAIFLLIVLALALIFWWRGRNQAPPDLPYPPETPWGAGQTTAMPPGGGDDAPTGGWGPTTPSPATGGGDFSNEPAWGVTSSETVLSTGNQFSEFDISEADKTEILFQTNKMPITGLLIVQDNIGPLRVGQTFPLAERKNTIGRLEDNHIMLDDSSVSRHHAEINLEGMVFRIQDLKAANGTKVNGQKIDSQILKENDKLEFGRVKMMFVVLSKDDKQQ